MQLPREWLGPTEDLVPFGDSAEDTPAPPAAASPPNLTQPTEAASPPNLTQPTEAASPPNLTHPTEAPSPPRLAPPSESAAPPSAQSFWTEDAASLHAALQGAAPLDEDRLQAQAERDPSDEIQISTAALEAAPRSRPSRNRRVLPPSRRPRVKGRAVPVLALSGLALALIVLIGGTLGSAHRPAATRRPASGARLAAPTADLGRNAADWRLLARVNKGQARTAAHSAPKSARPARTRQPRRLRRQTAHAAAPSSTYRSTVSYHAPAAVQPIAPGPAASGTSATPNPVPHYQPSSSAERRVTPPSTSTSTSNASNPSPASLLGPGHCACG